MIAGGGTLYFAFPLLYASSFSGFYLPLMIVLWLLILRAIGIEFRLHLQTPVWRDFFDGLFGIGSILLTIFFGAAVGNIIRGVPLGPDHYFFEPLWTNWRPGPNPGILDWYTVLTGLVGFVALTVHGGNYLAMKTEGEISSRARWSALILWPVLVIFMLASLIATILVRPSVMTNYRNHPIGFVIPAIVFASLAAMLYYAARSRSRDAFFASSIFLIATLAGAAMALYPNVLPASSDPALNLTIYNSSAGHYSLLYGLRWWLPGIAVAIAYFVFIYRTFRGKVSLQSAGHGY